MIKTDFAGPPAELAATLAAAKAAAVAARYPDALVIGSDQVLVCDGVRFDKPGEQAAAHLARLSGRTHELNTAVSVFQGGREIWAHTGHARLTMRALTPEFIDAYLAAEGAAVQGCAGAYRLEGVGAQLFEAVEGDYFTILGLPLLPLLGFLRGRGVSSPEFLAAPVAG